MALIQSFRDLNVYKMARKEAHAIFQMTKAFPSEERYSLTDQMRRSSRAVNAMLAEAWSRRRYIAAFVSKIVEASGETMETQAWLDHALDSGYITAAEHRKSDAAWQSVGAMLNRMIERAGDFCKAPPGSANVF
jgi:four helix bundle protein